MATIKDVARRAGVGVATASRVLSGTGSFSAEAAERVAAAARELRFRPNATARALSLQRSGTIGVYVPDFKGPFYGPFLHAIDTELRGHRIHMVVANGCGGDDDERRQALDGTDFLVSRDCDGLVVIANALRDADLLALHERMPHLAVVNRDVRGMKTRCFSVDHRRAGGLAAQALLNHGHRRIAVIAGPASAGDNRQRLQGFFDTLAQHGIAAASVPMEDGNFTAQSGWEATQRLLDARHRITALFCANDQMAMGALSCLQHAGISVPGDWSVLGYDDVDVAAWLAPRLSSVRIPIAEMAQQACRMLLNDCYGLGLPVERRFEASMVLRDSLRRR